MNEEDTLNYFKEMLPEPEMVDNEKSSWKYGMTRDRFLQIDISGEGLTEEEWKQGYHWCYEWDAMLVGPGQEEALMCSCDHPAIEEWKKSEEGKAMRKDMEEKMEGDKNAKGDS